MNRAGQISITLGMGLVTLVFLAAGILKLINPKDTLDSILRYQMLPYPLAWAGAIYLPWIEIIPAIALWTPSYQRASLLWLLTLMILFVSALTTALIRGLDISCGCFGEIFGSPSLSYALVRNIALLAIIILLFRKECSHVSKT